MSTLNLDREEFRGLADQLLRSGHRVRFQAYGASMAPFILDGDVLELAPVRGKRIIPGDVLLVEIDAGRLLAHRVIKIRRDGLASMYLIKGDASTSPDGWLPPEKILGRVEAILHGGQQIALTSTSRKVRAWLWVGIQPIISKLTWLPAGFRRYVLHAILANR